MERESDRSQRKWRERVTGAKGNGERVTGAKRDGEREIDRE